MFPFLNTPKGTSVMQFPHTWCPLTATARPFKCGLLLLYCNISIMTRRREWLLSSSLNPVIDLIGHLQRLFIVCPQPTSQQGYMRLDEKGLIM